MGNLQELVYGRGWWVTALTETTIISHQHQHSVLTYKWGGPLIGNLACQWEL